MRSDTKSKLDALERRERWRKIAWVGIVASLVLVAAYLYAKPSAALGQVTATVERSVVGVDAWGQGYHQLTVRLENGRQIQVDTFLVRRSLPIGTTVVLSKQKGAFGNVFYRLEPAGVPQAKPTR